MSSKTQNLDQNHRKSFIIFIVGIILLSGALLFYYLKPEMWYNSVESVSQYDYNKVLNEKDEVQDLGAFDIKSVDLDFDYKDYKTDFSNASVNLENINIGGPSKNEIPALNNPEFISIEDSETEADTLGILVEFDGVRRFYPFDILIWHEIVNDTIGDISYAVTYCPLSGSSVVYDRTVDDKILNFNVSGLLYESNMVMYDTGTESFWSQSIGEGMVGDYRGSKLDILPMQMMSFEEIKEKYPETLVLSRSTGYKKEYDINPYSGYEETENLESEVSFQEERYPNKELMYVIPTEYGSVAFPAAKLNEGVVQTTEIDDLVISVQRTGNEVYAEINGESTPGYYEFWFSWVVQHKDDGVIWEFE